MSLGCFQAMPWQCKIVYAGTVAGAYKGKDVCMKGEGDVQGHARVDCCGAHLTDHH